VIQAGRIYIGQGFLKNNIFPRENTFGLERMFLIFLCTIRLFSKKCSYSERMTGIRNVTAKEINTSNEKCFKHKMKDLDAPNIITISPSVGPFPRLF